MSRRRTDLSSNDNYIFKKIYFQSKPVIDTMHLIKRLIRVFAPIKFQLLSSIPRLFNIFYIEPYELTEATAFGNQRNYCVLHSTFLLLLLKKMSKIIEKNFVLERGRFNYHVKN